MYGRWWKNKSNDDRAVGEDKMEAIVNSSLSVLGIDEKNEILDFSMNVMTGRHGYAVLKLRMRDTGKGVNILKMSSRK